MRARSLWLAAAVLSSSATWAQTQPVKIQFKAVVGEEVFACGRSYTGIGTTKSTIQPKDLRFYIHNVRLLDETGKEVPVHLNQDGKWQLDNVVLLDFENGTGRCSNGNADLNMEISGTVPGGTHVSGGALPARAPIRQESHRHNHHAASTESDFDELVVECGSKICADRIHERRSSSWIYLPPGKHRLCPEYTDDSPTHVLRPAKCGGNLSPGIHSRGKPSCCRHGDVAEGFQCGRDGEGIQERLYVESR